MLIESIMETRTYPNPSNAPLALRYLAESILADARNAPADMWFGDRKVFLAAVLDVSADMSDIAECLQYGLLTLARADLVAAMDPGLVAASEWNHPFGVQYHFVVVA